MRTADGERPQASWRIAVSCERMAHLRIIEPAEATGALAEIYDRMRGRPMPPVYRPAHGGIAGIVRAHRRSTEDLPKERD
jgi:hypothetical protein